MQRLIDVSAGQTSPAAPGTGTRLSAPAAATPTGQSVDQLPLEILIGKARVVEVTGDVDRGQLERADLRDDIRVLLRARGDAPRARPASAALSEDAATYLVQAGIKLVGFDAASGGDGNGAARDVLLKAGVIVVEGLDLSQVAAGDYEMTCLPPRLAGAPGAPARVVLRTRP
jgi:arylformamidase